MFPFKGAFLSIQFTKMSRRVLIAIENTNVFKKPSFLPFLLLDPLDPAS